MNKKLRDLERAKIAHSTMSSVAPRMMPTTAPIEPMGMKTIGKGVHIAWGTQGEMAELLEESGGLAFSPSGFAIIAGEVEILGQHLASGTIGVNDTICLSDANMYFSLLMVAAKEGQNACGELLLKLGADMESRATDCDGTLSQVGTALMIAIEGKHDKFAHMLLEQGANVAATDPTGNTPVHLAVLNDNVGMLEALEKKNANLNASNINGRTPLFQAVRLEKMEALEWLLSRDVPVNPSDSQQHSPLHVAVTEGRKAVAHILLEHNAICHEQCSHCRMQSKLVKRAVKKSAEKREEKQRQAERHAAITEQDILHADELSKILMEKETELIQQQEQRALLKKKSKGQKKAASKQRKRLVQVQRSLKALRDVTDTGGAVEPRNDLDIKISEPAAEEFIQRMCSGFEEEVEEDEDAAEGEGGLTQAEIDEWLLSMETPNAKPVTHKGKKKK